MTDQTLCCPECGAAEHNVKDSRGRAAHGVSMIRRRRECCDCGHRFTTLEITEKALEEMMVNSGLTGALREIEAAVAEVAEARGVRLRGSVFDKTYAERSTYSARQKSEVLRLVSEGLTFAEAATRTGVLKSAVADWVAQAGGATALRNAAEAAE